MKGNVPPVAPLGLSPVEASTTVGSFFRRSFVESPPPRVPWRKRKVDLFFSEAFRRSAPPVTKSCGTGSMSARDVFAEFVWE